MLGTIKSAKANTGAFRVPVLQAVETVEPETVALVILLNLHLNAKKRSQYVIFNNLLLIKVFSSH